SALPGAAVGPGEPVLLVLRRLAADAADDLADALGCALHRGGDPAGGLLGPLSPAADVPRDPLELLAGPCALLRGDADADDRADDGAVDDAAQVTHLLSFNECRKS